MPDKELKRPPKWATDAQSRISEILTQNEWASFVHSGPWYARFGELLELLENCNRHLINRLLVSDDQTARLLAITASNHFISCSRSALSGHCLPAYPTGRSAVEMAVYAWYLQHDVSAGERWHDKPEEQASCGLSKPEEKAAKAAQHRWRQEFSFSNIAGKLGKDHPTLEKWANYLHQTAIDFGAHPNKAALYSNMALAQDEKGIMLGITVIHSGGDIFIGTLKFGFEVGLFILEVIKLAFPQLVDPSDLQARLATLKLQLQDLMASAPMPKPPGA